MDAELTSLQKTGLTGAEIGERLGKSRNAIIGRIHRLGIGNGLHRNGTRSRPWTPEELAALNSTRSNPQVAEDLGRSVDSVRIKRNKMGCSPPLRPRNRSNIRGVRQPPMRIVEPDICPDNAKPLIDLKRGNCRYPYGEAPPYLFCGKRVEREKSSFCDHHRDICYRPANMRQAIAFMPWRRK